MGLDGVELVMAWEESFGISIPDAEAAVTRTPRMATELICREVAAVERPGICLSQRAFYRLRRSFQHVLACPRSSLLPQTRVVDLVPPKDRRQIWQTLASELNANLFPKYLFGGLGRTTLADLTRTLVARHPQTLRDPRRPWAKRHVREVVRAIITDQLGIPQFSDDADFVYDLRVD